MLEREYQYFIDNRDDLVKKHRGKQVVIQGDQLIGVYDTLQEAYLEIQKAHELGTFLIQLCETEENEPKIVVNSRVRPLAAESVAVNESLNGDFQAVMNDLDVILQDFERAAKKIIL